MRKLRGTKFIELLHSAENGGAYFYLQSMKKNTSHRLNMTWYFDWQPYSGMCMVVQTYSLYFSISLIGVLSEWSCALGGSGSDAFDQQSVGSSPGLVTCVGCFILWMKRKAVDLV